MNTQAHALLNYVVLKKKADPRHHSAIFWGALIPDSPMFVFYFWEKILRSQPEAIIWNELYFRSFWQNFIDVFNSIPLICGVFLLGKFIQKKGVELFAMSMGLHVLFDFPLHHDDAHRHFFPLLDFRFESAISYWDPNHYGLWAGTIEMLFYFGGAFYVWKSLQSKWSKSGVVLGGLAYIGVYAYFTIFAFG